MPRKKVQEENVDEKLKEIEEKLSRYRKYTKDLEKERETLLGKKREDEIRTLYRYMSEHNISVPEVLAVLSAKAETAQEV